MRISKPLVTAISLSLLGTGVHARTGVLEEVIVTATKREASLQDIAVTVTAFSADTIQEAGINNASDIAVMTPSLTVASNTSPFNSRISIRGIGTGQTDPALEPSVGLFVDGVFQGRSGLGMSDLTDIERIEVLQGPQGTLYGKNTNAGAISVITKAPNMEEFEGYVEGSAGNYGMGKITASASGPLGDTVAYRVSGNVHQRDGYYDNTGGTNLNDADDWNLLGKVLWEPTDSLSLLLSGSHVDRDTTCCGADAIQSESVNQELVEQSFSPDKNDAYDYNIGTDLDSNFEMEADNVAIIIDYEQDWGSIESITAWNDYDYVTSSDVDRSQLDILSIQDDKFAGDSISQELRLSSDIGDSVEYQLGLFYYQQTTTRGTGEPFVILGEDFLTIAGQQDLGLPVPISFLAAPGDYLVGKNELETETYAVFGQATWHIGERWHITGGLRWSDEEKTADLFSATESTAPSATILGRSFLDSLATPIDAELDRSKDNVDWLLNASTDVGDDTMVFISAATGSKSGGFNSVSGTVDDREFDDETTMSYELGIKSTLLDSTLRVNATAFYTEIEDYQSIQQLDLGGTFVSNLGEVKSSGVDFYLEALPLPNLTLTAGLIYMHDYEVTEGVDKGLALPYTAEFSGNLSATFVLPLADGGMYIRADYAYMDDHSTNVAREEELQAKDFDDRNLLNMKVGWRNDNWNISVWGKNLTEDDYVTQTANTLPVSGMDAYFLAPPRTYGATLRYDF
ncbi:MAG: iron complex outermembrane receptor protein [Halioglobus sp.]|jgi:iron complex outermembrane receptor protein